MGTLVHFPVRRIMSGPRPTPKRAMAEIIILPVVRQDPSQPTQPGESPAIDITLRPRRR